MRQQTRSSKEPAEKVDQDIRRATRKHYSAEENIRIVLEGLRGEDSIAEPCRREGIARNLHYRWSKDFLDNFSDSVLGISHIYLASSHFALDGLGVHLDKSVITLRRHESRFHDPLLAEIAYAIVSELETQIVSDQVAL